MRYKKLSVIVPVYNERQTLVVILGKLIQLKLPIEKEIVIVDDGSSDGSSQLLRQWQKKKVKNFKVIFHKKNKGKGASIRTALKQISGDVVVIQDADLEYDPQDLFRIYQIMTENNWPVIYGSRHLGKKRRRHAEWYFFIGGLFLNWLVNNLYGLRLTDEATGYKMMETQLLKSLKLECERFEFCPEVTAKLARRGVQIREIPISYKPRLVSQGKKIRLADGVEAIWTLLKWRLARVAIAPG